MIHNYGKIDYIGYSGGNHCDRLKKLPQVSSSLIYLVSCFLIIFSGQRWNRSRVFFTYVQKILWGKVKKSQITT